MSKIRKIIAMSLATVSILSLSACGQKSNPVLATVNKVEIRLSDVDKEIKTLIDQFEAEYGSNLDKKLEQEQLDYLNNERTYALKSLVQEKILLQKAEELNLVPEKDDLDSQIGKEIESLSAYYGGDDELEKAKKEFGFNDKTFREFIEKQLIQEKVVEHVTKDVSVSEEEMKKFYEESKEDLFSKKPGANSKHILFETEEDALKCYNSINSKETTFEKEFGKYTRESADNADKRPLSEDLGYVEYEQEYFDKDFLAGFKKLKNNEVSKPIKSSFGYHIILATDIVEKTTIASYEEAKESISSQLAYEQKFEIYQNQLAKWEEELNVVYTAEHIGFTPDKE